MASQRQFTVLERGEEDVSGFSVSRLILEGSSGTIGYGGGHSDLVH